MKHQREYFVESIGEFSPEEVKHKLAAISPIMKETSTRMPKNRQFTLAGFKVDPKLLVSFADSFERLNASILTVHLRSGQKREHREINACVLPLAENAVAGLKKSPWFVPRRTVVYGIGGAKEATRFVELGVNALLKTSSDASIRAAVEATQSLLSRGVGAYGRVPLAIPVRLMRREG